MSRKIICILLAVLFPPAGIVIALRSRRPSDEKKILVVFSVLWTLLVAGFIVSRFTPSVDSSGWKHYELDAGMMDSTEENEDVGKTYAVIRADKDAFGSADAHTFIENIRSGLSMAAGRKWALFLFDDGTGILFPDADINEPAFYGEAAEDGTISKTYGLIRISGAEVTFEDNDEVRTEDGYEYMQYIPQEYINDSTYVSLKDGVLEFLLDTAYTPGETASVIMGNIRQAGAEIPEKVLFTINGETYQWTGAGLTMEDGEEIPAQEGMTQETEMREDLQ